MTTTLPETMLLDGVECGLAVYLLRKSKDFSQRHPERKEGISTNEVSEMLRICIEGADGPEETEKWWDALNMEVCEDLYLTEQFNNQKETMPETTLEPAPKQEINTALLDIVEAARTTTMASGFSELLEKYNFGPDFTEIIVRDGSGPTPRDLGAMCGLGVSLGNSGQNLVAAAVSQLLDLGGSMEDVVNQIGSVLKLKYSTLSNYNRTYLRTPRRYKHLPFDVQKEISTSTYGGTDKEDAQVREQLFEQAEKEGWSGSEARSARKAAQGHDEPINANAPGSSVTPWRARYVYSDEQGNLKMSKTLPVFFEGQVCVDLKDMSALTLEGNKFVFLPIEKEGE